MGAADPDEKSQSPVHPLPPESHGYGKAYRLARACLVRNVRRAFSPGVVRSPVTVLVVSGVHGYLLGLEQLGL
jgi:hypothetical protein